MKRILILLPLSALMMGNQKCQDPKAEVRELKRRVEMGAIDAPAMSLPDGKKFDFKFVANAQMYDVLRKTKSFSTATMDGTHELEQMTDADRDAFNRCDDDVLSGNQKMAAKPGQVSTVATCMINMPQAVIEGSILNFEVTNKTGVSIDLLKPVDVGFSIDVTKAVLAMSFQADDPLIPGKVLAATTSKANRFETKMSANINFGMFSVGPSAYFKSELSGVVSQAMQSGISDLKAQMDEATPWYAMVIKNCDKAILINAGGLSDAGLKKGDVLEVYNVRYRWTGDVCNSALQGAIDETPQPIAVAEVEIVGDTLSQAKIVMQTEIKIQPGSRVYVRKLIQPVPPVDPKAAQKLAAGQP
ncbi:MAG: hypothetical protein ACXWC9_02050 [Pseudobdellovibrionaceae bacterium]